MKSFKNGILILLLIAISAFNLQAQCLTEWRYYKPVTITNNTSDDLSDFQFKITVNTITLINNGKMKSNGDDIRFTVSGSCTTIPYWIESGNNSSSAAIWVKIPSLKAYETKEVLMFYGNPLASAGTNGNNTFDVFDEFNGSSLDNTKWDTYGSNGTYNVSNGILTARATYNASGSAAIIRSKSTANGPLTAEMMVTGVSGYYPNFAIQNSGSFAGYALIYSNYSVSSGAMYVGKTYSNQGSYSTSLDVSNTSPGTVNGLWTISWPSSNYQTASWPGGSLSNSSSLSQASSFHVSAGMLFTSSGYLSMDWIRARKYAASDPSTSIGSEVKNNTIEVGLAANTILCSGRNASVPYNITGLTFNADNVFTAQLSDASGSFSSPVEIGKDTSNKSGAIKVKLPDNISGNNYRIRVISSSPAYTGIRSEVLKLALPSNPAFSLSASNKCLNSNIFSFKNNTVGSGNAYIWDFGDGDSSTLENPKHSYKDTGSYTVRLFSTPAGGCTDSVSMRINVYAVYPDFTVSSASQCLDSNLFVFDNITVGNGQISYLWNFGDGNTSSDKNTTHHFSTPGTYEITLYTDLQGCKDSATKTIVVHPEAEASFSINNDVFCKNQQNISFTNLSFVSRGTLTYEWNFGDNNTSTQKNPKHTYASPGFYKITLKAISNNGCTDNFSDSITILPAPDAILSASGPVTFCEGHNVVLFTNTSASYAWLKDGVLIQSAANTSYTATQTGSYQVINTNAQGCKDTSDPIKVIVNPLPNKPVITENGNVLSTNAGYKYQWFFESNILKDSTQNKITVNQQGNYTVKITDTFGCSNLSEPYYFKLFGVEKPDSKLLINIYPNPAEDVLFVDLQDNASKFSYLEINTLDGKLLKSQPITKTKLMRIDVSGIPKGIYIIKLLGENDMTIRKVILK